MSMNFFWVALGGALGSVLRYALGLRFPILPGQWPWATFGINTLGCLLIGMLWAYVERSSTLSPVVRPLLMVGVLGGFTTFSTFGLESLLIWRNGQPTLAVAYMVASMIGGLLLAAVGAAFVERWL